MSAWTRRTHFAQWRLRGAVVWTPSQSAPWRESCPSRVSSAVVGGRTAKLLPGKGGLPGRLRMRLGAFAPTTRRLLGQSIRLVLDRGFVVLIVAERVAREVV
jgi:hypothetical protein